jgi:AraC family transcriptional regulator of adaptative response/methylated-DNA-[protein]-cysteine methyltransferase
MMDSIDVRQRGSLATSSDPRWASVVARDAAADGTFFYSVETTGVYCQPSCPARLANPENVRFHPTRDSAEAAGYRPCRRCRPDRAKALHRWVPDEIRFGLGTFSLGLVLVAQSSRGICAVLLGDDADALSRDLAARFPNASLLDGGGGIEPLVAKVVELIESPDRRLDEPLDLRGSEFQRRVWHALREIPAGATASYTEIANRLGMPNGARAVAGACAANPLAVIVPCHRAITSDGRLSGYRWGVERKRSLLEAEGAL